MAEKKLILFNWVDCASS